MFSYVLYYNIEKSGFNAVSAYPLLNNDKESDIFIKSEKSFQSLVVDGKKLSLYDVVLIRGKMNLLLFLKLYW